MSAEGGLKTHIHCRPALPWVAIGALATAVATPVAAHPHDTDGSVQADQVEIWPADGLLTFSGRATVTAASDAAATSPRERQGSFYAVSVYDPGRDPNRDLEHTIERARNEDKQVLLVLGGDWCMWCKVLDRAIEGRNAVSSVLSDGYVVMKVDYAEPGLANTIRRPWSRNGKFLRQFPRPTAFPYLIFLDRNGTVLHSQDLQGMNLGSAYEGAKLLALFETWDGEVRGP